MSSQTWSLDAARRRRAELGQSAPRPRAPRRPRPHLPLLGTAIRAPRGVQERATASTAATPPPRATSEDDERQGDAVRRAPPALKASTAPPAAMHCAAS